MMNGIIGKINKTVLKGDARTVKMQKNIFAMFGVRGLSILITLLYVPLMLRAVTQTEYGILLTLTTIVHWVSMLDIGIGNGLRNKLATALANNDNKAAKSYVASSYIIFIILAILLIIVFLVISPHISWQKVLNAPDCSESELLSLANIVFITFCIQFPLGLINSILFAFQLPAVNSIINLISHICGLLSLVVAVYIFDIHSLLIVGALTCIVPPVVILLSSLYLFSTKLKIVCPAVSNFDFDSLKGIVSLGVKFFILQIITLVLYQANNIIITHVVNPAAVVQYNIAYRFIGVITMLYTIVVTPVWSATTDAYTRGDWRWIKNTVRFLKKVSLFSFIAGLVMVVLSKFAYKIWLGSEYIEIPYLITGLILAYVTFKMLYQNYAFVINGTGKVHAQMIITALIAIAYIPLTLFLGNKLGLEGVIIGSVIVQLLNFIWSKIQYTKIISGSESTFWTK